METVLNPALSSVFINDLEVNIRSPLMKFVDDTLTGREVNKDEKRAIIPSDLNCLVT